MASPRFAWGIDVGNRALKAIRLVREGEQYRIDDFEVIEHEYILSQAGDNRDTLLQTALANFAQKHNSKGGEVAIGVSGQSSFARFIKLPPVDPSKVPDIVKFEAVQQIPFPLDEVEWSYQLFQAPESPEIEVGIFAMKKDLVNQIIKNFTDVKLAVNAVQMNPLAVYNGLAYDGRLEGTTMIVDVGAENSDLIIADGENIWMRSIPVGGNNFTEALIKSFKLKFPKAEELKRNAATSKYGRQILQAMKPVFSDLVGEIQRSIGFYSSTHRESRIGKVLALGGTFRLPGLQKYLQQNLQLEVVRIDRLNAPMPADARFAAAFNENILSSISAYGLALQAMGVSKIKSSLLPEKIRRERMWRQKTPWFATAAALFMAGTIIPVVKLYVDKSAFDQQTIVHADQIKRVSDTAQRLDKDWRTNESSGSEDRTRITDYMTLLADRDMSLAVTQSLAKAVSPSTDPGSTGIMKWFHYQLARPFGSVDQLERIKPRTDRIEAELVGWKMRYEPDVSEWIAHQPNSDGTRTDDFTMSDDNFNKLAEKIDLYGATSITAGGEPFSFRAPNAATGAKPNGQRGFLVTLLCKTPYTKDPTGVVSELVGGKLWLQRVMPPGAQKKPSDKPVPISIERVSITSGVALSKTTKSTLHSKKPPLVFTPPGSTSESTSDNSAPPTIEGAAAYPDPLIKGESMINDSLVTVLAVIVIDPPAKK